MTNSKWSQVNVRIESVLFNRIKKHIESNNITLIDFVVKSFEEKLARKIKEDKDEHAVDVFIDEMIALHPKRRMADIQNGNDLIWKEILKQNEILKLILRRATLSSKFSSTILIEHNESVVHENIKIVEEQLKEDLQNIKLVE